MRRSLSPKERTAMLEAQGGQCAKCRDPIGSPTSGGQYKPFIAEHWHMVALGNAQKPDCLLCLPCAHKKTNGTPATSYGSDKHAIAQTKRRARKQAEHEARLGPSSSEAATGMNTAGNKARGVIPKQPFRTPPPGYKRQWPKRKVGE